MVRTIIAPPKNDPAQSSIKNERLEKLRLEESKLVKGVFQDNELKGGKITFPFKKYKEDPIVQYTFEDGKEYEVPLAVVRHLNRDCAYETHHHLLDANGLPMKGSKKTHRFSFKNAEFM